MVCLLIVIIPAEAAVFPFVYLFVALLLNGTVYCIYDKLSCV